MPLPRQEKFIFSDFVRCRRHDRGVARIFQGCLLKKGLQRGGHGQPRTPSPLATPLHDYQTGAQEKMASYVSFFSDPFDTG